MSGRGFLCALRAQGWGICIFCNTYICMEYKGSPPPPNPQFLSDPGIPGVRSMGRECLSLTEGGL